MDFKLPLARISLGLIICVLTLALISCFCFAGLTASDSRTTALRSAKRDQRRPNAVEVNWSVAASMNTARQLHTATLLPNGKILVVGGSDLSNSIASAELYDPLANTWTNTGSLIRARREHSATLLPNGKVLVVGVEGTCNIGEVAELFDHA